jgi:hypothetical protein
MGIWNRSLSSLEIMDVYINGKNNISYIPGNEILSTPITTNVTLISPATGSVASACNLVSSGIPK